VASLIREKQNQEWSDKLLKLQADNLWSIGTVGESPLPVIARSNMGNMPATGMNVWDGNFLYPFHVSTFFFKK
jgi:peptide/nickel transport system substrate-binding protein